MFAQPSRLSAGSALLWQHHELVSEPLISVVMTVRNGAATIEDQLGALARQTIRDPWEVVVVDNGSSDDTAERALAWRDRLPVIRLIEGPALPAIAASLNAGVAAANASRLAFCDHDDLVGDGWLNAMCEALSAHDHVAGPLELTHMNPPELVWGEHVTSWLVGLAPHRFMPFAMTCNAGWRREVFDGLGGFTEYLPAGHDRDLSWRTQLAGYGLWFAPDAIVHRRQRESLRAAFHQHLRHGRTENRLIARFEAFGTRPPSRWERVRGWIELAARLPWLARRSHRMRWFETAGVQIGYALPLLPAERRRLLLPTLTLTQR